MGIARVIPVLLLRNKGLVKTVRFKEHKYIGDPINAVKIFNEKEVDELIFLDIDASKENREPNYEYLKEIASECFMPLSYGGGIKSVNQIKRLVKSGIEKVIINSESINNPSFIAEAANAFGSSTIVAAVDYKKNFFGKIQVYSHVKKSTLNIDPLEHIKNLEKYGAGEIFINSVDKDGTLSGYDIDFIKSVTDIAEVPVIACGGASTTKNLYDAITISNASAAAAGSLFVFHGKHRAVLITYPKLEEIQKHFNNEQL